MRPLLFCMLMSAAGVAVAAEPAPLAKGELLRHLANDVMLPLTADFATAAGKLASTAEAYCAQPARASQADMQAAWRAAESAWQPLEMLQIGPVIERRTQRQVNAWPARPNMIEPLLSAKTAATVEQVERLGVSGKGFPALEYLLFDPRKFKMSAERAAIRCSVVQALAQQLKDEADGVAADWRTPDGGFARQLAEAGATPNGNFADADQAVSDVVNLMIAGLDAINVRKLGKPLEKSADTASLERIESWRAGTSLEHIRDNLRGFDMAFFGPGANGIGLDDYLAGLGRPGLGRVMRTEMVTAYKLLATIRLPLRDALVKQRPQVEALYKQLQYIQQLMESEIAEALQVDLGFNANDGD